MNPRFPLGDRLEYLRATRTSNNSDKVLDRDTAAIFASTLMDNNVNIALGPDSPVEQRTTQITNQQEIQEEAQAEKVSTQTIVNNAELTSMPLQKTPTKMPKNLSKILELSPHTHLYMGVLSPEPKEPKKTNARQQLWPRSVNMKKSKFEENDEEKPSERYPSEIPLATLLLGLSKLQLIKIITDRLVPGNPKYEKELRNTLPKPDLRIMEQTLLNAKEAVLKSLPIAGEFGRKGDFSKAVFLFDQFTVTLDQHIEQLKRSYHWDALIDYVCLAWPFVRCMSQWDSNRQNAIKKKCYELLIDACIIGLNKGGLHLGSKRLQALQNYMNMYWCRDTKEVERCLNVLNELMKE